MTVTFQKNVQNEESLGASDVGRFFVIGPTDVATIPSLFLQNLSQGRVCADSLLPRDFAALPGQQKYSARSTLEVEKCWNMR